MMFEFIGKEMFLEKLSQLHLYAYIMDDILWALSTMDTLKMRAHVLTHVFWMYKKGNEEKGRNHLFSVKQLLLSFAIYFLHYFGYMGDV